MFNTGNPWKDRIRASAAHFVISCLLALIAAALVFLLWYPYPYREISGGRELFFIIVAVDVIMGPLITFSVFNRKKPMKELRRDLALVGLLQLAALFYGLWTVFVARPVHLVFEYDRFRTVHAIDVPPEMLGKAAAGFQSLPLTGPTTLSLRPFANSNEKAEMTMAALGGVDLSARPELWQDFSLAKSEVFAAAKPLEMLIDRFPAKRAQIESAAKSTGHAVQAIKTVPMSGRKDFWTVLIDSNTAEPLAYLPIDSF